MDLIALLTETLIKPRVKQKAVDMYIESLIYLLKRLALILCIIIAYKLTNHRVVLFIGSIIVWIFFIISGMIRSVNNIREISRFANRYLSPVRKIHKSLTALSDNSILSAFLIPFVNLTQNLLNAIKGQIYYFICVFFELMLPLVIVYYIFTRSILNNAGISCWDFLMMPINFNK
jgi:hypothetical protein